MLGMGDSSYEAFNWAAKKLRRRLGQLGGEELMEAGLADDEDAAGPDTVAGPWIKALWEKLAPGVAPGTHMSWSIVQETLRRQFQTCR